MTEEDAIATLETITAQLEQCKQLLFDHHPKLAATREKLLAARDSNEWLEARNEALEVALRLAIKDLWAGYNSTRSFIDDNVPDWIRGDDSPSYPCIQNIKVLQQIRDNVMPPFERPEREALIKEMEEVMPDFRVQFMKAVRESPSLAGPPPRRCKMRLLDSTERCPNVGVPYPGFDYFVCDSCAKSVADLFLESQGQG